MTGLSALFVWAGVIDPKGGVFGVIGSTLRGQTPAAKPHDPNASFAATLGSLFGASSSAKEKAAATGAGSGLGFAAAAAGAAAGDAAPGAAVSSGGDAAAVIAYAEQYLGTPYVFGGSTPAGFDCSGFVQYVYAHAAGIKLPRTAAAQQQVGQSVQAPAAGDLVFFGYPAYHVGIYLGGGRMIEAPHTGDVVKEAAAGSITSARRVLVGSGGGGLVA